MPAIHAAKLSFVLCHFCIMLHLLTATVSQTSMPLVSHVLPVFLLALLMVLCMSGTWDISYCRGTFCCAHPSRWGPLFFGPTRFCNSFSILATSMLVGCSIVYSVLTGSASFVDAGTLFDVLTLYATHNVHCVLETNTHLVLHSMLQGYPFSVGEPCSEIDADWFSFPRTDCCLFSTSPCISGFSALNLVPLLSIV